MVARNMHLHKQKAVWRGRRTMQTHWESRANAAYIGRLESRWKVCILLQCKYMKRDTTPESHSEHGQSELCNLSNTNSMMFSLWNNHGMLVMYVMQVFYISKMIFRAHPKSRVLFPSLISLWFKSEANRRGPHYLALRVMFPFVQRWFFSLFGFLISFLFFGHQKSSNFLKCGQYHQLQIWSCFSTIWGNLINMN